MAFWMQNLNSALTCAFLGCLALVGGPYDARRLLTLAAGFAFVSVAAGLSAWWRERRTREFVIELDHPIRLEPGESFRFEIALGDKTRNSGDGAAEG